MCIRDSDDPIAVLVYFSVLRIYSSPEKYSSTAECLFSDELRNCSTGFSSVREWVRMFDRWCEKVITCRMTMLVESVKASEWFGGIWNQERKKDSRWNVLIEETKGRLWPESADSRAVHQIEETEGRLWPESADSRAVHHALFLTRCSVGQGPWNRNLFISVNIVLCPCTRCSSSQKLNFWWTEIRICEYLIHFSKFSIHQLDSFPFSYFVFYLEIT